MEVTQDSKGLLTGDPGLPLLRRGDDDPGVDTAPEDGSEDVLGYREDRADVNDTDETRLLLLLLFPVEGSGAVMDLLDDRPNAVARRDLPPGARNR